MVSTQFKNISQNGNLPQVGMKINNIWNHHPVSCGENLDLLDHDAWKSLQNHILPNGGEFDGDEKRHDAIP